MEKDIIIKVNYTFEDFVLPIKQKILKSWRTWLVILIASIILIFNLLHIFKMEIYENRIPIFNMILPITVFIIFPLSFYFKLKSSFKKNFLLQEETTIIYNKLGIKTNSKSVQSFIEWDKIKSIKEYIKYFVLRNISGLDSFLNKSFFNEKSLNY
jgi:hypothetical protein